MTMTLLEGTRDLGRHWRRDALVLALAVIVCALPFLNQPFHMDDNFYMDMARNAQRNPLFPNDAPYMFQGILYRDLGSHSHPPLQTYFLAAVMRLFGEGPGKEWIYHLAALVFPLLAVLSFYAISARFVGRPLWPSLLLAFSPLFLIMQHNLMTDIPTLALWLGSIGAFLWATETGKARLYAASATLQTAAMLASYQSLALTPLLGFYHVRRGGGRKGRWSLLFAPVILAVWYGINCLHYKRLLFGMTLDYIESRSPLSWEVLGTKLFSVLEYQGWLILFPFFIFYVLARGLKGRAPALALLGALYLAQAWAPEYRAADKAIFVFGLAAGLFVALEMGRVLWIAFLGGRNERPDPARAEHQFLGLWYFGVLFYCVVLLTEGSARYILPLVPPFLICYFRRLETAEAAEYRLPPRTLNSAMVASGSLVVTLLWGLVLSHADLEFARVYPRAARQFAAIAQAAPAYGAGEWGFRYYMGMAGARPLPADESTVRGGSFIAIPKLALPHDMPAGLSSMTLPVEMWTYRPGTPIRILDCETAAGFYSTGWGLIPFSISGKPLEEIEVRQVGFMIERLPWARVAAASDIRPWPGIVTIGGRPSPAILVKPGTRISYPLSVREPADLELLVGFYPESGGAAERSACRFEIRQTAGNAGVLAEIGVELRPGTKQEDNAWRPARLRLRETAEGALDFEYTCGRSQAAGAGAFAQAVLRPAVGQAAQGPIAGGDE